MEKIEFPTKVSNVKTKTTEAQRLVEKKIEREVE